MITQGNLSEVSFPRLLESIYARKDPSGVLDIVHEPVRKRFFFKDGVPVASTSNVLGEVLGRLLMDEGIITQDDYEFSLEKVIKEKKRHGEVLISMGLITEEKLDEFLKLQLKRRALNLFTWEEGNFRYVKAESLPEGLAVMPMHPGRLILEGISLGFYPASRIKGDLAEHLDRALAYDQASAGSYGFGDMQLNLQEQRFLARFDGTVPLRDLLDTSDLLRHRALSIALTAVMTGMVSDPNAPSGADNEPVATETLVTDAAPETRMGAELLFMKAKSSLIEDNYAEAAEILTHITELNPMEAEYWAYLGWAVFNADNGRADEAEKILKDAIDLNNELDRAWYFLGMVFLSKGDEKWAERAFVTAVEKNPWLLSALAELKRIDITRSLGAAGGAEGSRVYPGEFSFETDPFTAAPDRRFLIESSEQEAALVSIAKTIKKRSGPVLLEGPKGAGKTTVILELLRRLSSEKVLCAVILDPPAGELGLIRAVNAEAGSQIESTSIKEQLLSLGMRLSQNKIQGGHNVIIIDEAHRLTPGCLKLVQYLSRLKTLQVVLVAEPSISETLAGEGFSELNSRIVTRAAIGPLTMDEAREFITTRLGAASGSGQRAPRFELDPAVLSALLEESGGLPGSLLTGASVALSQGRGFAVSDAVRAGAGAGAVPDDLTFDEGHGKTGATYGRSPETAASETSDWLIFDDDSADEGQETATEGAEAAGGFMLEEGEDAAGAPRDAAPDAAAAAEAFLDSEPPVDLTGVGEPGEAASDDATFDTGASHLPEEEPETTGAAWAPSEEYERPELDNNLFPVRPSEDTSGVLPDDQAGGPEPTHEPLAGTGAFEGTPSVQVEPEQAEEGLAPVTAAAAAPQPSPAPATAPGGAVVPAAETAEETPLKRKTRPRSILRLIIWVVVMLIAGLIVGSLIGVALHGELDNILGSSDGIHSPVKTVAAGATSHAWSPLDHTG